MRSILKRIFGRPAGQTTYSQLGEDLLIQSVVTALEIEHPTYLDIGANDPIEINNTARFYMKGARGVCVEPDPELCAEFRRVRPRDSVICAGVSATETGSAPFYVMNVRTLNTFSREDAENLERSGNFHIERVLSVPLIPVNEILRSNFVDAPTIVSLDTEGRDFDIITAIDFDRYRPRILCVETISFSERRLEQKKLPAINELLRSKGYFVYADTYVNTIFVDQVSWG